VYRLTPVAETLFPKAYGELTNELLNYVADEDGTLIEKIFVRRRDQRITNARTRLAARKTMAGKVKELARILDEDGYLAEFEALPDGTFRVTEHNCAILSVARQHPDACQSELAFIRAVLPEASVERISHIIAGQHHCGYQITPR
jgi:predicted ArsR family transcriptional regulator